MTFQILYDSPPPQVCASILGKKGAQVRQDRAREASRAFHRDMRAKLGLPAAEALA